MTGYSDGLWEAYKNTVRLLAEIEVDRGQMIEVMDTAANWLPTEAAEKYVGMIVDRLIFKHAAKHWGLGPWSATVCAPYLAKKWGVAIKTAERSCQGGSNFYNCLDVKSIAEVRFAAMSDRQRRETYDDLVKHYSPI